MDKNRIFKPTPNQLAMFNHKGKSLLYKGKKIMTNPERRSGKERRAGIFYLVGHGNYSGLVEGKCKRRQYDRRGLCKENREVERALNNSYQQGFDDGYKQGLKDGRN